MEHHVYVAALLGMSAFYGLEKSALRSRSRNQEAGNRDVTETTIFWLHIVIFAVYNALIGYLLVNR